MYYQETDSILQTQIIPLDVRTENGTDFIHDSSTLYTYDYGFKETSSKYIIFNIKVVCLSCLAVGGA